MVQLTRKEQAEFNRNYDEMLGKVMRGQWCFPPDIPPHRRVGSQKGDGAFITRHGDFITENLGTAVIRELEDAYQYARLQRDMFQPDREIGWIDGSACSRDGRSYPCAAAAYAELPSGEIAADAQILDPHPMDQDPATKAGALAFTAECCALRLQAENTLRRAKADPDAGWDLLVAFCDSKSAIKDGLCSFKKAKSGGLQWERDIERTLECLRELRELGVLFQIHWVPAHIGVRGNAEADNLARKTARDRITVPASTSHQQAVQPSH